MILCFSHLEPKLSKKGSRQAATDRTAESGFVGGTISSRMEVVIDKLLRGKIRNFGHYQNMRRLLWGVSN